VGEAALRFLQGGLEVSKGSNIAATRIVAGRITNVSLNQERAFIDDDRGSFAANYSGRYSTGAKDYGFTLEADASFEQLPWLLQTAAKGSCAPSVGVTTFTPSTTGVTGDDLQAACFEYGDDTQGWLLTYAEANSWTLGFDSLTTGGSFPLKFSGSYFASAMASNTRTPGLTFPTLETIEATDAKFYIGSVATAYGSIAELRGSLRQFSLSWENGLAKKLFVGDGKSFSAMGRGKRVVTFDAVFEGNADGVSRFVEWDLATEKRIRLLFSGDAGKYLDIRGRVLFTSFDNVGAVDTNTVFAMSGTFVVEDSSNGGLSAEISLAVKNEESSYT
jgi:hypothetical protein